MIIDDGQTILSSSVPYEGAAAVPHSASMRRRTNSYGSSNVGVSVAAAAAAASTAVSRRAMRQRTSSFGTPLCKQVGGR